LPVHARQKVEVVRLERAIAELIGPVLLELPEPAEPESGVHEPAVEPRAHQPTETVETRRAEQALDGPQAVAAARGRVGRRERGILRLEERPNIGTVIVVAVHGLSSPAHAGRPALALMYGKQWEFMVQETRR